MNKKYGVIYKITNLVNGKCYIGQTISAINHRFNQHIYKSKEKNIERIISKAIRKYGKENFKIEEISVAYTQEQLNFAEEFYIKSFNTISPNGYNLMSISEGYGRHSEETKQKMRILANKSERILKRREEGKKRRGKAIKNSISKYCGVSFFKGKWVANHSFNNKTKHIGTFLTEEDAGKARDIYEINIFGKDSILNFPELIDKYLNNKIVVNKCLKKKSNSDVVGVSFCNTTNRWIVRLMGFKGKKSKTKQEAEKYALECLKIRNKKLNQ